ncbi:flagellar protein FlaG [Zobellella sp. DQSA1]|uniref:flagellar protein FlaG n=1 Tax=Zobellella sp. DQSA1 TaxID=3342386 RepID=UPI0035C0FED0
MDTSSLTSKPLTAAVDIGSRSRELAQPAQAESTQTVQAVQQVESAKKVELKPEQLEQMAEQLEQFVSSFNRGLTFSVHEGSGRQVVSVVDKNTGETIRQIPSEELLDVISRLAEAGGGLIDTKV